MLRNIAKSAIPIFLRSTRQALIAKPTYTFAAQNKNTQSLREIVQSQISYQQKQLTDLTEFTNFFEQEGYTVKYDGIQVELSKKNGQYNVRIVFNARTPSSEEEPEQQEGQEGQDPDQYENDNFTQISAFVNKEGTQKWLSIQFMVAQDTQISQVSFITDYQAQKSDKKKGRLSFNGYMGPDLSSLDEKLQESIYSFIEHVGLNGEVLQKAAQFSVAYEHQFYLEWLKDLKSIA